MPPIIEDYAAIKRRMDELANPPVETEFGRLVALLENNLAGFVRTLAEQQAAADKAFLAIEARGAQAGVSEHINSILTDEGRALIEKHNK